MPVNPSGGITMAEIATELGISTSSITMSNLRAQSNAYTSGTANHTGVNTTNNVEATPDTIAEWAGYIHAQSMGTIDYGVRISTANSSWGIEQNSTSFVIDDTATASGGITIWRTHDGSNTYIRAKRFHDATTATSGRYYDGSASNLTTSNTGQILITIPVTDVTIAATVHGLVNSSAGYSGSNAAISGTGAALLVCRGAEEAEADPGSADYQHCKFKVTFIATKTGYTTTTLDGTSNNSGGTAGIIVHSTNDAEADGGE